MSSNFRNAALMEIRERQRGRYPEILSRAEDCANRIERGVARGADAQLIRVLVDIIARQEIELRQAIIDKNARPVVERI